METKREQERNEAVWAAVMVEVRALAAPTTVPCQALIKAAVTPVRTSTSISTAVMRTTITATNETLATVSH